MYEPFFGLSRRPFSPTPLVEQYFPAAAVETARATLVRCVERGEGIGLVIGPSGTGKTLLCQMLAAQFGKKFGVALLSGGRFTTRRALFQAMLYEIGQSYRGLDEGEARLALVDLLAAGDKCPNGMLLIVDDAHTLPLRLLDEIRMLTNISRQGQLSVRLVLAGASALEERLASPKLESFSQQIVARCYLEAFSRSETQEYVQGRINAVGASGPRLFCDEACQTVYRATDGVPRLINQVCDHALLLAFSRTQRTIEPPLVEEAWADLQQLPTPWNGDAEPTAAGGSIEFGQLDDEPADAPTAGRRAEAAPSAAADDDFSGAASVEFGAADGDPAERSERQVEHIEQLLDAAGDDFRPAAASVPEVELIFDDPHHPFAERFAEEEIVADRYAHGRPTAFGVRHRRPSTATAPAALGHQPLDAARPASEAESMPHTVPMSRGAADRDNLLVIDDGYDDGPAPAATCKVAPVRKHQFQQLFAGLRRSGT